MEEYLTISDPLTDQIKIDFDKTKRIFVLSMSIFRAEMPTSVKKYVDAREGHSFKPHKTFFQIDGGVVLLQEVPFTEDLRDAIQAFWRLAKSCHHLLVELAVEENYLLCTRSCN